MIKYIAYAYLATNINTNITPPTKYCEVRDLQSPFVKPIDDSTGEAVKYMPVMRCVLPKNDAAAQERALLECLSVHKRWMKI